MKYLQPSFTLPAFSPEPKPVKREGRTTYIYCPKCEKVHEVLACPKAKIVKSGKMEPC